MTTAEGSLPEIYLNYYNAGQSKLVYISDSISPSPSAQSESSLECAKEQQHDDPDSTCCDDEDDSTQELTNLTWLTQLKSLVEWPNSINPILDDDLDKSSNGPGSALLTKKDSLNDRFQRFVGQARQNRELYDKSEELYQMDTSSKPPFNYAQMIAMAMLENGRMTLQHIYSWIQNKFGYYRVRNNWNNSIRHNLSLQFCFRKIDRSVYNKGDGKGGYWELGIDANKSQRKRIRNRSRLRTQKDSPEQSHDAKRRKGNNDQCIVSPGSKSNLNDDMDIFDDYNGASVQENNSLFGRTLNSINAPISGDKTLQVDDVGIVSIIEVSQANVQNQHDGQVNENGLNQQDQRMELNQSSSEYHVLADITHVDYLNALDIMSSADDMFGNHTFMHGTENSTGELTAAVSNGGNNIPTIITTMIDSMEIDNHCSNEIYLASEVPQPSENVVISALNHYDDDTSLCNQSTDIIIEDTGATCTETMTGSEVNNLIKSFNFENIDQEFQLIPNCSRDGRDELIEVLYGIASQQDF